MEFSNTIRKKLKFKAMLCDKQYYDKKSSKSCKKQSNNLSMKQGKNCIPNLLQRSHKTVPSGETTVSIFVFLIKKISSQVEDRLVGHKK